MPAQTGLLPIVDKKSRTLILGSFPGPQSLELRQYYAAPRNAFWKIVGDTFGFDVDSPYKVRVKKLTENCVGLWDVLGSCERIGAADNRIRNPIPNDFRAFFARYPDIRRVMFNGRKAEDLFMALVGPEACLSQLQFRYLPSTSAAHAIPYEQKLTNWQNELEAD